MLPARTHRLEKTLESDAVIFGVCGGFARYFNIDPTIIRAGYLVATVLTGFWPLPFIYMLLALLIPKERSF